jgi:phage terminase Nu1 subunit (DNA packaging protein)
MLVDQDVTGTRPAALPAGAPAAIEPEDLRNIEETARFFDVTPPTVRAWIGDGCPVYRKGSNGVGYALSLRAVAGWRQGKADEAEREAEAKAKQSAQLALELLGDDGLAGEDAVRLTPKQQAEALAAELARVRLAKERGELVRAASVQLDLLRALTLIRDRVRALPDRLATALGWREEEASRCVAEIDNFLEELAAEGAQIFNETIANARADA